MCTSHTLSFPFRRTRPDTCPSTVFPTNSPSRTHTPDIRPPPGKCTTDISPSIRLDISTKTDFLLSSSRNLDCFLRSRSCTQQSTSRRNWLPGVHSTRPDTPARTDSNTSSSCLCIRSTECPLARSIQRIPRCTLRRFYRIGWRSTPMRTYPGTPMKTNSGSTRYCIANKPRNHPQNRSRMSTICSSSRSSFPSTHLPKRCIDPGTLSRRS